MNALTSQLDLAQEREAAERAVSAILTRFSSLFGDKFTADDALEWGAVYRAALVGEGSGRPLFAATDIGQGALELLTAWRWRRAPLPADVARAVGELQAGRRAARGVKRPNAATQELSARCKLCGAHKGAEDGPFADGRLPLYRDAGAEAASPWLKRDHPCGHSRVWLHQLNSEGWYALSQLPGDERFRACGFEPAGPSDPLRKIMDRLGDALARSRRHKSEITNAQQHAD